MQTTKTEAELLAEAATMKEKAAELRKARRGPEAMHFELEAAKLRAQAARARGVKPLIDALPEDLWNEIVEADADEGAL